MALQLRRGLNADRVGTTFAEGEPIWTTDTNVLYVGDGVTPGGIEVSGGGGGGVTEIIAGSNITVNTSTGAVTISGQPGGVTEIIAGTNIDVNTSTGAVTISLQSTSTYQNLEVIDTLTAGEQLSFGTGTYRLVWGQSPPGSDNQFYINGTGGSNVRLFYDQLEYVQFNSPTQHFAESRFYSTATFNSTITVQALTVGLNTGTTARDFGYGAMPYNANNMKIELPNNGSSLFFAFKNPSGVARNVGFSRQGNIVLQQGSISNGFPSGVLLQATDGGQAFVGVSTNTNGVVYSSRVGANTSTGVFQTVQNNAGVNFSTLLDYTGTFTVPRDLVVTTTATVATLKFGDGTTMTTAPVNEADQSLNTTSDVTFNSAVISTTATVGSLSTMGNIDGAEGYTANMAGFRAGLYGSTSGFAFKHDTDSGMFSWGEGDLRFRVNNANSALVSDTGWAFQNNISVVNTATANEVVVGPDLNAIKSISYNTIGVEGNWHVGNVLEVGTGDGNGYITSTGNNNLTLNTSGNNGPGGSVVVGSGDNAGVGLYSGNSQEFQTAFFNTLSNTINYGLTVNGATTVNGPTTVNSATTFNADATFNVNNTMTVAGMTIGVSNSVLIPNVILSSSTNVLVQTPPTSGGHIIFGMNRFGLQRPLAITRTGGIAFDFGQQIYPGQGANVGNLSIQAASTSSGTANTLFLSSGGTTGSGPLARGVFSDASGLTIGTRPSGGATAFNSSVFDLNGGLTLPKSLAVGTTATVASTMILPVYTAAALTAITGQIGSVAIVSDSAQGSNPNGMMAFWDTTNSRWSYVHDNSAV